MANSPQDTDGHVHAAPQTDAHEQKLFRMNALQLLGEWSVHDDDQGHLFYYNLTTKESQWEAPPDCTGLEGELMMKLMLQHAVARSGFWSAHDAGNGTLYYFNERTRESVWERPQEWGIPPPPPPPPPQEEVEEQSSVKTTATTTADERDGGAADVLVANKPKKEKKKSKKKTPAVGEEERKKEEKKQADEQVQEREEQPPSAEEIEAAKQKEADELKRIESFRQMLRDKKIMPFTKWSVAMPRIISDPRFMAVPTMDERRAIFEHFVQHRRDDLKAEKKAKLTGAKKVFTGLLRELFQHQLEDGTWDGKTSLPVFLTTMEDALEDAARYKSIQESAMAFLPTSVQEKLYEKTVSEYKAKAEEVKSEEKDLLEFLRQKIAASKQDLAWESDEAQHFVTSFYASKGDAKPLLSKEKQRSTFRRVQAGIAKRTITSVRAFTVRVTVDGRDLADEQEREMESTVMSIEVVTSARLADRDPRRRPVRALDRTPVAAADAPPVDPATTSDVVDPLLDLRPHRRDLTEDNKASCEGSLIDCSIDWLIWVADIHIVFWGWKVRCAMEASIDTLVYQLEDEDPQVRWQTLQKLRKIAAVESSHFPVRNPRRFLHCVRRRIIDDEPRNAVEALRLITDIMGVLGDDVEQILSSILPHLIPNLPNDCRIGSKQNEAEEDVGGDNGHVTLHDETFQVFRKYVIASNDLKAVVELLINMGLAHGRSSVREASVLVIVRLLEERYCSRGKKHGSRIVRQNYKVNRMDKSLFVALFQALIPVLEDSNENVVVIAEEALGKLHLYWGDGVDAIMQFLNTEDRRTLQAHQEHIHEFLEACSSSPSTHPSSPSNSFTTAARSSPSSSQSRFEHSKEIAVADSTHPSSSSSATELSGTRKATSLHFGFVKDEVLEPLTSNTSNSNFDWKRRAAAVEKLFAASKQVDPVVLHSCIDEMEELFDILVRLLQDADVHLVKRAIQIAQVLFHKFSDHRDDGHLGTEKGSSSNGSSSPPQNAAFYMQKMIPHLVETAANFAEDEEMEAHVRTLFVQLFQGGFLTVARASQTLLSSLEHRRLQIREEALRVWMVLLLVAEREGFNTSKVLSHNVLQALGRLLGDNSLRVKEMAFETGALLASVTRAKIPELIEANLDEYLVDRVDLDALQRRLRQPNLPILLENGMLSLHKSSKSSSTGGSARSTSYGSVSGASSKRIATEKSLSGVSELHMLMSRELGGGEHPQVVRQSRHHVSETESLRRPIAKDGSVSPMNKVIAGSMSDRSYFMEEEVQQQHVGGYSPYGDKNAESVAIADKLAMLKKKTSQLRRSASTKHVQISGSNTVSKEIGETTEGMGCAENETRGSKKMGNEYACGGDDMSNQPLRSQTSPERYDDQEHGPVVSARRRQHRETPASKSTSTLSRIPTSGESQSSPQKLQMLQSSAAACSYEDRPIKSTFSATYAACHAEDDEEQAHDPSTRNRPRSSEDRPISSLATKTQKSSKLSEYPDEYPSSIGNNDMEAPLPRKVTQPSLATRKRLEAKQRREQQFGKETMEAKADKPCLYEDGESETYAASTTSAAPRPVSLATRKRLEAKAKQDGLAQATNGASLSTDSLANAVAVDDDYNDKPLPKKTSFFPSKMNGGSCTTDDKNPRPSGLGNKEPRYLELHEIKPLANPKQDVAKLLSQLRSDAWEVNFDALSSVRRLAMHHPTFLEDKIHAVTKEILAQVPNLRSTVSKNSLLALDSMCSTFQRTMDSEVDTIISVLIKRSSDSNAFVCESATSSINSVISNCSASKVVNALAVHLSSKAVPIRREVARGMHTVIVSLADQIQSSKDLSTILSIVGKCLEDSNNEVRDAAKQSILYLCYEQRIDAERLKKMLPQGAKSKVDQVLSGKVKYAPVATNAVSKAGIAPAPSMSAASTAPVAKGKARPDSASSHASSSSSAAHSPPPSGVATTGAILRKAPTVVDTTTLETLQKKLESSNWKDRYDALTETTAFVCSYAKPLTDSGKIIGLFDTVIKRMEDGNSKVNVYALECLEKMIPALGNNGMELVLSNFIPVVTKNLAASTPKLAALAQSVIQVLCAHVEAKLLCQHFAAIARHANSRIKPLLIDTLEQLAAQNDEKNQYALNRYVLPLAFELVKEAKSDVKDANTRLLRSLHANLGTAMLQSVYRQSTSQQEKITSILGISNFAKH